MPIFNASSKDIFFVSPTQRENEAKALSMFDTVGRIEERLREQALSERVLGSSPGYVDVGKRFNLGSLNDLICKIKTIIKLE